MNLWIVGFIIIFMLHNLEEIIMIEKWMGKVYPRVIEKIPDTIQKELNKSKNITSSQFAVVVFMVSIFASIIIMIAITTDRYSLFFGLNLIFALNIFTHPLQSLYLRAYTPGLLTSLLLIIPYNIFFLNFYITSEHFTKSTLLESIILLIIFIPIFILSHRIGKKWD